MDALSNRDHPVSGLEQIEDMRAKERVVTSAVLLALAAVACQPGAAPPAAPLQPSVPPPAGQPSATVPRAATAPPAAPADPQPSSAPTAAAVREALQATDPSTVVLGAGRPTLVEFFAFW